MNFKAYASENLVMLSGTTFETDLSVKSKFSQAFETYMQTMVPRYTAMGGISPYEGECGVYNGITGSSYYMKITLP